MACRYRPVRLLLLDDQSSLSGYDQGVVTSLISHRVWRETTKVARFHNSITPVLTVLGAEDAVTFYMTAFGAEEIVRNSYPDGRIVAEMAIGDARFRVADETPEAGNISPQTLNGTTVRINLLVDNPDKFVSVAVAHGAIEVASVTDQSYGLRQGRIVDPFGHHWLIGRPLAGEVGSYCCARIP